MQRFLSAGLGLLALVLAGTTARAEGLNRPRHEAPFNWSGFYVGLNAGGAWADADWLFNTEPFSQSGSSAMLGGQAGLQWQWGNLLAGVEISYSAVDLSETTVVPIDDRTRTFEINDLLLATVRVGYAADRWLGYVKGGYANADVDFITNVASTGVRTGSSSGRESGWTIGGGLEYALSRAISLGVEYNFVHLNIDDRTQTPAPGFGTASVTGAESDIHSVAARLNVKF